MDEIEMVDIYLLFLNEDFEMCIFWFRMCNCDGYYMLMFVETVTDGSIMILLCIKFEVGVCIFGGFMVFGYVVGVIMKC